MRRLLSLLVLLPPLVLARPDAASAAPLTGATTVDGGLYFTCARMDDSTVRCWGDNQFGQLGNGTNDDSATPVTVQQPGGAPLTGVSQLALGDRHACALLLNGQVACWGRNVFGQLGDGTASERTRAVLVHGVDNVGDLTDIARISIGAYTSCALTTTHQVRCWGDNGHGQLGNGYESEFQPTPVVVLNRAGSAPLSGVAEVSLGHYTSCARMQTGQARCWGQNFRGQVGDGTTEDRRLPRVVRSSNGRTPLRGIRQIVPGYTMSCAVVAGGQVRCWGDNAYGTLGIGTTDYRDHVRPQVVLASAGRRPLAGVRRLDIGDQHVCAALTSGQVRCWGRNYLGPLGDGTFTSRSRPVAVNDVSGAVRQSGVTSVRTGMYHTCARLSSGELRCWGGNQERQLGDGTTFARPLPIVPQG